MQNFQERISEDLEQALTFKFDVSRQTILTATETLDLKELEHSSLLKRLNHYSNWAREHNRPIQFEFLIFNNETPSKSLARTILISPSSDNRVQLNVLAAQPIKDALFNNPLDRKLMDAMNDVVLVSEPEPFDRPGPRVIYINKAFEKMTGYTADDIIGKTPRILQNEQTSDIAKRNIRGALNKWEQVTQVLCNQKKNGDIFYVELDINPVADETGWFTHWVAVQRDVTDNYYQQLNRRQILDAVPEATVSIDADNNIIYYSKKSEELWEYTQEEVMGKNVSILVPDSIKQDHDNYIEHHRKTGENRIVGKSREIEVVTKSGKTKSCQLHIAQTELPDGKFGYTAFIKDITLIIEQGKEIEHAKRVNIAQSRLASLGELAAGVGHEVNNPLQVISGHLDILKMLIDQHDNCPAGFSKGVDAISAATDRIAKIVSNLKKMSQIKKEVDTNKTEEITLICMQTVDMLQQLYKRDIRIELDCPATAIYARIDSVSLQQILVNLISNAKDALSGHTDNTVKVKVKAGINKCLVSIEDKGSGIPDEIVEDIFQPFYTTKPVGQGTGLGLSITKSMVESIGGKIYLETKEGVGTKFTVELTTIPNQSATMMFSLPRSERTLHVLVVDDESEIRNLIQWHLIKCGHNVTVCDNPEDGIERFVNTPVDVVISDFVMPKMNGREMLQQMQDSGKNPGFKSILISGFVDLTNNQDSSTSGDFEADSTLQKPFSLHSLSLKIDEITKESNNS